MSTFKFKGEAYICTNEKALREKLENEGLTPTIEIKESFQYVDPEAIRIVVDGLLWSVNGYLLGKIIDRIPSIFKKE